ncbi:putative Zn-binding protein involved in type VI secretion [Luteibacter rhizovicinus]|uniref:Putative Zn-binding protein involved in type VI secretion n=1 Tax=Luteibacter rhizovicinus TaxID=242606 RepID=A0A4R3YQ55_9GAMM|nr:PAAR domain-containing protein [Luteibacter rhizovicinus]TCV94540.1 putative Zn-binding protein involved in type VI secretion [Luteibacter rhizovicinus]
MSRPIVVVGDITTHGGRVISGCPVARLYGLAVARIGDKVICDACGTIASIVETGLPSIGDEPRFAVHGDRTSCGAWVMSSLWRYSYPADVIRPRARSMACIAERRLQGAAALPPVLRFRVSHAVSGLPVPDTSYVVPRSEGGEDWRYTDAYGLTDPVTMACPDAPPVYFEFGLPAERRLELVAIDFVPEELPPPAPQRRRRGRPRRDVIPRSP